MVQLKIESLSKLVAMWVDLVRNAIFSGDTLTATKLVFWTEEMRRVCGCLVVA